MVKMQKRKVAAGFFISVSLILLLCAVTSSELFAEIRKSHTQANKIREGMSRNEVYATLEIVQIGAPASFKSDYGTQLPQGEWTETIPLYRNEALPPGEILVYFCDGRVKNKSIREPAIIEILAHWIGHMRGH